LRVLDGLESAATEAGSAMNRRQIDKSISALGERVFLLHNVHSDSPVLFQTRWAMSYLRGHLTRKQVRQLTGGARSEETQNLTQEKAAAKTEPISVETGAYAKTRQPMRVEKEKKCSLPEKA